MHINSFLVVLLSVMLHAMGKETSVAKDFDKADRYEGRKIHRLWRELEQGMFPFMMNEVGELTEKNGLFVSVAAGSHLRGMGGDGIIAA